MRQLGSGDITSYKLVLVWFGIIGWIAAKFLLWRLMQFLVMFGYKTMCLPPSILEFNSGFQGSVLVVTNLKQWVFLCGLGSLMVQFNAYLLYQKRNNLQLLPVAVILMDMSLICHVFLLLINLSILCSLI